MDPKIDYNATAEKMITRIQILKFKADKDSDEEAKKELIGLYSVFYPFKELPRREDGQ